MEILINSYIAIIPLVITYILYYVGTKYTHLKYISFLSIGLILYNAIYLLIQNNLEPMTFVVSLYFFLNLALVILMSFPLKKEKRFQDLLFSFFIAYSVMMSLELIDGKSHQLLYIPAQTYFGFILNFQITKVLLSMFIFLIVLTILLIFKKRNTT